MVTFGIGFFATRWYTQRGIGTTTSASCLVCLLLCVPVRRGRVYTIETMEKVRRGKSRGKDFSGTFQT